jgi:hypothetical protein
MCSRFLILTGVFGLLSAALLQAQSSTGEIDVTVTDASEALVSGARIVIKGSDNGRMNWFRESERSLYRPDYSDEHPNRQV